MITFKHASSAKKAFEKLNSEKHKNKNIKVAMAEPTEANVENCAESREEGKVVYLKFDNPEKVPEKEKMKNSFLKKYGLVTKIFRKKEGKTFYLEFSSEFASAELLKEYDLNEFSLKPEDGLIEVDYAFNKGQNFNREKTKQEKVQTVSVALKQEPDVEQLDPNKHWQVYYDSNYERNFYYNPFFNESVWELPEKAEVTPFQDNFIEQEQRSEKIEEVDKGTEEEAVEDNQQDFYDEDAWEEEDLVEKLVWDKMKEKQLAEWMKRPARQQVTDTRKDTSYVEGNNDYNIWYDKYLTDRKEEKEKIPAMHRCNPHLDSGYTKADLMQKEGSAYFCRFFAKGCCSEGVNCNYYHRVPTRADAEKIENLRDVFGRARFAKHRTDMGGVGTFTKECRTLYVSDIKTVETGNPVKEMIRIIYDNFSDWGEIEDINYIPPKGACFVRYVHRCFAEFGKEAMIGQALVGEEIITVKWAYDDPNPVSNKKMEKEHENKFLVQSRKKEANFSAARKQKAVAQLPNVDYQGYYERRNNPYNYSSGYGYEEEYMKKEEGNKQITEHCVRLSETLQNIENNLQQESRQSNK